MYRRPSLSKKSGEETIFSEGGRGRLYTGYFKIIFYFFRDIYYLSKEKSANFKPALRSHFGLNSNIPALESRWIPEKPIGNPPIRHKVDLASLKASAKWPIYLQSVLILWKSKLHENPEMSTAP